MTACRIVLVASCCLVISALGFALEGGPAESRLQGPSQSRPSYSFGPSPAGVVHLAVTDAGTILCAFGDGTLQWLRQDGSIERSVAGTAKVGYGARLAVHGDELFCSWSDKVSRHSSSTSLVARDLRTGAATWCRQFEQDNVAYRAVTSLALAGRLYFHNCEQYLRVIEPRTGEDIVQGNVRQPYAEGAAVNDEVAYTPMFVTGELLVVGTANGFSAQAGMPPGWGSSALPQGGAVICLRRCDLRLVWRWDAPGPIEALACIDDSKVAVVTRPQGRGGAGGVVALELASGRLLWTHEGWLSPQPYLACAGVVCLTEEDSHDIAKLTGVSGEDGRTIWAIDLASSIGAWASYGGTPPSGGLLLCACDVPIPGGREFRAWAIEPRTGSVRWTLTTDGCVNCAPVRLGDLMVLATDRGAIYGISVASGAIRWGITHVTDAARSGGAAASTRVATWQ